MQTKMKSMKMSAAEKKSTEVAIKSPMEDGYPYGLRLELNQEVLEKLGIELPQVGEKLSLEAAVEVKGVHASENEDGKKYASCSLQITDMAIESDSKSNIADRLYKKEA